MKKYNSNVKQNNLSIVSFETFTKIRFLLQMKEKNIWFNFYTILHNWVSKVRIIYIFNSFTVWHPKRISLCPLISFVSKRVRFSLSLHFCPVYKYNKVNTIYDVSLHFFSLQECSLRNPYLPRTFLFYNL